jgi:hypothetical protein
MELYNLICEDLLRICKKHGTEVMGCALAYGRAGHDLPDEMKAMIDRIINLINSGQSSPSDEQVFNKCTQKYGEANPLLETIHETLEECLYAIRNLTNSQ